MYWRWSNLRPELKRDTSDATCQAFSRMELCDAMLVFDVQRRRVGDCVEERTMNYYRCCM